jgi:hypothetical protein
MAPYSYSRPLDRAKNEIRLLRIMPGSSMTDDLQCKIDYASLHEHPVFSALSYTWNGKVNDPALAHAPTVLHVNSNSNNPSMEITANLNAALRYLRPKYSPYLDEELYLWVDAVCINQCGLR